MLPLTEILTAASILMAVIVSKPCQEIAVSVKHDMGQIVREQMPQDNFVYGSVKHAGSCAKLSRCKLRM